MDLAQRRMCGPSHSRCMPVMTVTSAPNDAAAKVRLQILSKSHIADGVCRIVLGDPGGYRLPDWTPGSHIDVTLGNGETRQYSLCGDRWDPLSYEIAVLREAEGRGGSRYMHDQLGEGDVIEVGGPRNNFALAPAERYLFIAGGIGITPILPMLEQAEMMGTPWTLHYGGRTRSSMAYLDRLERFGDRVVIWPEDIEGRLPLDRVLAAELPTTKIYCCGPGGLLAALDETTSGRPVGHVRTERFVPRGTGAPVRTAPFEVEFARTGRTVVVGPETSILAAAASVGASILASCRQGTCGTCETAILGGQADHRDSVLDLEERATADRFFPCVSRAASDRLILDA